MSEPKLSSINDEVTRTFNDQFSLEIIERLLVLLLPKIVIKIICLVSQPSEFTNS